MSQLEQNTDPFAKDSQVRLAEINEELQQIQNRLQELEEQRGEIIKSLHGKIGDLGTQDILEKVWEQKQTTKK